MLLLLGVRSRAGEQNLSAFLTSSSSKDLLRPVASFPLEHPNKSEPASPQPSFLSLSVVPTSPLTCSILWSDATLDLHRLTTPSGTSDEASLEHTRSLKLACYDLPPLKARSKTSSRSSEDASPLHMAPAGQFLLLAGVAAEKARPKLITAWDPVTGICVHTHKLSEPESGQDDLSSLPKDNAIVQILSSTASASTEFFVAGSGTVWACPSIIPDRSLSLSLGNAKLTASLLAPPSAAALTDSSKSLVVNLKDVVKKAVLKQRDEDVISKCEALCTAALASDAELLGFLDDRAGRQAEAAFLPKLRAFLAAHSSEVLGASTGRSYRFPKVLISQHVLKRLVTGCLEQSWTAAMGMLLNTRLVSSSSCPELIPTILQQNNMELLEAVLTKVHDISEVNLVRIIRHLLSMKDLTPVNAFLDARRRSGRYAGAIPAFPNDTPIEGFLRLVICAPRNDIFLTSSLRSLTFRELRLFLTFLGKWLHRFSMCLDLRLNFKALLRVPTLNQLAEWISAVVDAHYTTLVTSEELQPLVRRIIDDAAAQLHFCSSMQGLLPVQALSKLDPSKLPKAALAEYSIEVVSL